jgi:hypothetical protein
VKALKLPRDPAFPEPSRAPPRDRPTTDHDSLAPLAVLQMKVSGGVDSRNEAGFSGPIRNPGIGGEELVRPGNASDPVVGFGELRQGG